MIGAYVRVSSDRQGDGESPENQRERLKAAGANEFYIDVVSGFKLQQRRKAFEFQRLTADIKAGKLTQLITTRFDRIARRDEIFLELAELCEKKNVEFSSLQSGQVDTTTTSGWLSIKMQMMLAEHYSRQLSENVRNGLAAQIARGVHTRPSTGLPFHLAPDPNNRRGVIPGEAWDDARHAIEQILAGHWTLSRAARFVDDNHGRVCVTSTFSRWLKNPAILGHMGKPDGTIQIASCWPALVTESEHEQLLAVIARARKKWGANKESKLPPKAISGLCVCVYCNEKMSINTCRVGKYKYEYLRCISRYGCSVKGRNTQAILIEQKLLIQYVMPRIEEIIKSVANQTQPQLEPTAEKRQWLRELRHRKQTPPEFLMASDRERINELELLIARANEPTSTIETPDLAALALRLTNVTLDGTSSWFSDPPPVRNRSLRMLLQSVTVDAVRDHIASVTFALDNP